MTNYKKRYRDLESSVLAELRCKIEKSNYQSKFGKFPAIKVNVFDYIELAIIDNSLTFLDHRGYHVGIYVECGLEDLIDILSKN